MNQQISGKLGAVHLLSQLQVPLPPPGPPTVVPPTVSPRFQPGAPIYEMFPLTLLSMSEMTSLRQRVGTRLGRPAATQLSFAALPEQTPFWMRVDGAYLDQEPDRSTTGLTADTNIGRLQIGADAVMAEGPDGYIVGGVSVIAGTGHSDITSFFGTGSIDTESYGIGLTATYYTGYGLYVDGQAQYLDFESDLRSDQLGELADGVDGHGIALSVEVGQTFAAANGLSLTPQAQLSWASVSFDDFVDQSGARVSLEDGDNVNLRFGLSVEHVMQTANRRQSLYGVFNVSRDFQGQTLVDVSGADLINQPDEWEAEIDFGGQIEWNSGTSVFGEISYATGLDNFGDSQSVRASAGFRWAF